MAASAEKHLKLVVSAYTAGAEAGLKNVQGAAGRLRAEMPGMARALRDASRALDVRTMRQVNHEVEDLRKQYRLLRDKGVLSQKELAQAATNLKTKTADLRAEYARANSTQKQGIAVTRDLTGHVKRLVAAYLGYRTITAVVGGMVTAARNAEQAQFNLATSVEAANREFDNVGSLEHWRSKIGEMSESLRIYSESDIANAISRTVDMTKRLGLSAAQMEVLVQRSADLSAGKTELTDGIERVTSALRGEAEASEYLGLTLNETYVAAWHAAHNAHGRAWKDLTDLEKAQVRFQVLLEQSAGKQGAAAESANTLSGSIAQIKSEVSDAIANNEDFARAMTALAATIRENSDEIGAFAGDLADAIGTTIEFIAENKTLILTLVGAGGTLYAVQAVAKGIGSITKAVKELRKAKMAETAAEATGSIVGISTAAGGGVARIAGLRAALAALRLIFNPLTAVVVASTAAVAMAARTYVEWQLAADEAEAAHRRLMDGVDETLQKFEQYKDFRLPGLDGKTVEELQSIQGEIAHTHNYWQNMVIDLQDRANQTNWFGGLTEDAKVATVRLADAKRRLQQVKDELNQVNGALRTTGATAGQSLMTMEQALEKVQLAVLRYHEKQDLLTAAMTRARDEQALLKADVQKLAEAYYQAAVALKTTQEGTGEHAKALAAKLQAEADYVAAVQQLHQHQMQELAEQYADEEKELQQRLEKKLLDLEQSLELEWITEVEYAHRKAQAEEELARAVLEMRRATMQQSAKIYGEDSHEYRQARAAMVDAELALQRASMATRHRWEEMIGIAKTSEHASKKLADSLAEVGRAGKKGGDEAAGGLAKVGKAADSAKSKVDSLNRSLDKQSDDGEGQTGRPSGGSGDGQSMAQYFHDQWNATTEMIQGMDTFEELAQYEKQYRREIYDMSGRGSWMSSALRKHARDMVRKQRDALRLQSRNQLAAATAALRQRELQAAGPLAPAPQGAARKVTVEFKAPNGQSVSGQFGQGDADRLLDVLRQSGAVTSGG